MLYRGIRFTLRQGIVQGTWTVVLHPEGDKEISQGYSGSRSQAEKTAHGMIDRLIKRTRPAPPPHE
jgi:hypothetical protein